MPMNDANTSVYMPFYCSMTEVPEELREGNGDLYPPEELREGNGDLYNFSPTANFWVNNQVANQAYHRYTSQPFSHLFPT